jgi:hypothetical protein
MEIIGLQKILKLVSFLLQTQRSMRVNVAANMAGGVSHKVGTAANSRNDTDRAGRRLVSVAVAKFSLYRQIIV